MDRAAWQATVHVGHKESDTTEGLQFMESQRVWDDLKQKPQRGMGGTYSRT